MKKIRFLNVMKIPCMFALVFFMAHYTMAQQNNVPYSVYYSGGYPYGGSGYPYVGNPYGNYYGSRYPYGSSPYGDYYRGGYPYRSNYPYGSGYPYGSPYGGYYGSGYPYGGGPYGGYYGSGYQYPGGFPGYLQWTNPWTAYYPFQDDPVYTTFSWPSPFPQPRYPL